MVAGSQDEDCPHSVGVQLFEAVGRGGPGVAVAGVRADDGLGWVGGLVGSRQPGGQFSLQLGRVGRVPGVGVARSPRRHPGASRGLVTASTAQGAGAHSGRQDFLFIKLKIKLNYYYNIILLPSAHCWW